MDVGPTYAELLQYPYAPKVYRRLRDYYRHVGMELEAQAFELLLANNHDELSPLKHADNSSNNAQ